MAAFRGRGTVQSLSVLTCSFNTANSKATNGVQNFLSPKLASKRPVLCSAAGRSATRPGKKKIHAPWPMWLSWLEHCPVTRFDPWSRHVQEAPTDASLLH